MHHLAKTVLELDNLKKRGKNNNTHDALNNCFRFDL